MVGLSSVLSGEGSSTHKVSTEDMLLGMGLIVASQVGSDYTLQMGGGSVRMGAGLGHQQGGNSVGASVASI